MPSAVWQTAKMMWEAGLVTGSAGNVSRRIDAERIAITPSGVPYGSMTAEDIVIVHAGSGEAEAGVPSYELPMHLAIYRSRPEVGAVVHTHAPYVTTLSILRKPLPPLIDEMVVHLGGPVPVADYAFTGTEAVGTNVVRTLGDRTGVLLANHGNVCVGRDLGQALNAALVMESCARAYVQALAIGTPVELPHDAVAAGRKLFETRYRS
ncbi:MAG TPA: class II aldolase/adducin family protein [Thermoanaerobaculia bacterium]|nr:class II aldolase/adducin family protein [Thermoanaerobaculia bacterium]